MDPKRMTSLSVPIGTQQVRAMRIARAVVSTALIATISAVSAASTETGWVLRYVGHSANEVMWDPRLTDTLRELLPEAMLEPVNTNLGGPPGPVLGLGPDISLSACRAHDCGDKAFLWIETSSGTALGATAACPGLANPSSMHRWNGCRMSLGSLAYTGETVPLPARRALMAWLSDEDMEITSVRFTGPDNASRPLDPAAYSIPTSYQPLSKGPSFECTSGLSDIDMTICADPALSALDLKLQSLYDQIRRGTSTAPARDELRQLELGWVRTRNRICAGATGRTVCLRRQYQSQLNTLGNWLPHQRRDAAEKRV